MIRPLILASALVIVPLPATTPKSVQVVQVEKKPFDLYEWLFTKPPPRAVPVVEPVEKAVEVVAKVTTKPAKVDKKKVNNKKMNNKKVKKGKVAKKPVKKKKNNVVKTKVNNARAIVRRPTATECAQLRGGIARWGEDVVLAGAAARGISAEQVALARRACRV